MASSSSKRRSAVDGDGPTLEEISEIIGKSSDLFFLESPSFVRDGYWPVQQVTKLNVVEKSLRNARPSSDHVLVMPFIMFERKEWVPARRLHKFASKFRELRPSRSQGVYSAEFWRAVDEAKTLYNEMLKIQRMQTCGICSKGDNEAILLLCSACERACHIYCDNPPLREVPEGDWYCHKCRGATYDRKRGAEGESPGEGVPTKRPKM